jgi:hypothetical protein
VNRLRRGLAYLALGAIASGPLALQAFLAYGIAP